MNFFYERITYIFDPLHHLWEHEKMHRKISVLLVLFFLGSLIGLSLVMNYHGRRHHRIFD